MSSAHRGVSRKKTSSPSHIAIAASARSTESNAYWTSTMIVVPAPTAPRTALTTSAICSSEPTRPLWTYGPENVASTLQALKPISLARAAQLTIDSTYASNDPTSGCSDAYGVSSVRAASPQSCQQGTSLAFPQMSQSAMSSAPRAWRTAPRRPDMALPT